MYTLYSHSPSVVLSVCLFLSMLFDSLVVLFCTPILMDVVCVFIIFLFVFVFVFVLTQSVPMLLVNLHLLVFDELLVHDNLIYL